MMNARPVYWPLIFVLVAMFCVTLFSAFFTANDSLSWSTYLKSITQIFIIFMLLSAVPNSEEQDFIARWVAWLPTISLVLGIAYHVVGVKSVVNVEYASGVPRLGGSLIPPFLAGLCIAGAYAAIRQAEKVNPKYLYLAAFNFLILLLTSARMPLFIATMICFIAFMFGMRGKTGIKTLVVFFGLCGLFLFLAAFGDAILGRLTQTHMSGREVLWDHLKELLAYYHDFGLGFGHQVFFMPKEVTILTGGTIGAHNEYLRIAVEIGYWPAVVFFGLFALGLLMLTLAPGRVRRSEMLLASLLYLLFCATDNVVSSPTLFLFLITVSMLTADGEQACSEDEVCAAK
ncbi:hypothetical protein GCM10025776_23400 [Corallincola platygyrae]